MTFIERAWNWFWDGLSHFFSDKVVPALKDWAGQFQTDAGQIVLEDAAKYGPLVLSGAMTMLEAIEKLGEDLLAKEITVSKELIGNAIRTWTNSAAMQGTSTPAAP